MARGVRAQAPTLDVLVDADVLGRHRTGDESYVANLLRELPGLDGAVDLRVGASSRHPELVPHGITPLTLAARGQALRLAVRLPRLAGRTARLLHTQYVVPPRLRVPAVVTVHDLSFEHHPEWMAPHDRVLFRTLVPRAVRQAARVLTVSEFTKLDIVERYGVAPDKVVVTHNGVDPAFSPEGPRPDRAPYLLFVGALQPRKDLVTALEALARLPEAPPLVVVGPVKRRVDQIEAALDRLQLRDRVELVGHVAVDELRALYRGAEALVFPSLFEGFGLPVLEAMASGTPVVTTTTSALPEVAGDAAVLVPPSDPAALAEGIARALTDGVALRAAGLARAATFRWDALAATTRGVYEEVLS
jgi:glycosyltransferase involved in cell wall biosynthesis